MSYADALRKGIPNDATLNIPKSGIAPVSVSPPPKQPHNIQPRNTYAQNNYETTRGPYRRNGNNNSNTRIYHVDAGVNLSHKNLNNKIGRIMRDAVVNNCRRCIVISTSVSDAGRVVSIVKEHNKVSGGEYKLYCTIGVHPHEAERTLKNENWVDDLNKLIEANSDIVLAV